VATGELQEIVLIEAHLGDFVGLGGGPKAVRMIAGLPEVNLKSDCVNLTLVANDCADCLTMSEDGAPDVRMTLKTDYGAIICAEYAG